MIALLLTLFACLGGEQLEALRAQAVSAEQQGELRAAGEAWMKVFQALEPGVEREALGARMSALERRLWMRRELIEACRHDPAPFAELKLAELDEQGARWEGQPTRWQQLPLERIGKALAAARLSRTAHLGFVHERLERGSPRERVQAFSDLAQCVEAGEIRKADAWATLARARGEPVPAGGYVYQAGRWQAAEPLAPQPPPADAALASWKQAQAPLFEKAFLDPYRALEQQYLELERLRGEALSLIFDEERYFYPFQPPECSPDKARLFPAVQQEVDRRVAEVRRVWKSSRRLRVSAGARTALAELRKLAADPALARQPLDPRLPESLRWIDPQAEEWTLANFARNAAEAQLRLQDAIVRRHNEPLGVEPGKALLGSEEREQLRITNAYRQMLGRHLLAWNQKLQSAAREHSQWMSTTGRFGHFQDEPALRTPFDRMRAEGYLQGAGENVHMGDSGPEGAHVGWTHSSGHHRQILSPTAREFAAGLSGPYWTQNYGTGTEYLSPR
jgi:uncharacterized protein YkwD